MSELDNQIGFRLVDMAIPSFELFGELPEVVQDISIHAKLDWAAFKDSKSIHTGLRIEYRSPLQLWVSLEVQCQYEIELHAWQMFMMPKDAHPQVPRSFLEQLAAITIGSARGILFEKTRQFGGLPYLLPLLTPGKLIPDVVILDWR